MTPHPLGGRHALRALALLGLLLAAIVGGLVQGQSQGRVIVEYLGQEVSSSNEVVIASDGSAALTFRASEKPSGMLMVRLFDFSKKVAFGWSGGASDTTLTFTGDEWKTGKAVTLFAKTGATAGKTDISVMVVLGGLTAKDLPVTTLPAGQTVADSKTVRDVTVSAVGDVTEGSDAEFSIAVDPKPMVPLTVKVKLTQQGAFAKKSDLGTSSVVVGTSGTATLSVLTVDDSIVERDGTIKLQLLKGDGYQAKGSATATVNVDSEDVPMIKVSAPSTITEGQSAALTLTLDQPAVEPIVVQYSLGVTDHIQGDGTTTQQAVPQSTSTHSTTIGVGQKTVTITKPTVDDNNDEANGAISFSLMPGSNYGLGNPQSASVAVQDDDDVVTPVVEIRSNAAVIEGGDAVFTIVAKPPPTAPLSVSVEEQFPGTATVTNVYAIPTTTGTYELRLSTTDDSSTTANTPFVATLQTGSGYTVGSPSSATVQVIDNDAVASKPTVQIDALRTSVTEMEAEYGAVQFVLSANPPPTGPVPVRIQTQIRGGSNSNDTWVRTVVLDTTGIATFDYVGHALNNGIHGANDPVVFTLLDPLAGTDTYAVGTRSTASVALRDDDPAPVAGTLTQRIWTEINKAINANDASLETRYRKALNAIDQRPLDVKKQLNGANGVALTETEIGVFVLQYFGTSNALETLWNDIQDAYLALTPVPVVRVTTVSSATEGESIVFSLTADPAPPQAIFVTVDVQGAVSSSERGPRQVELDTSGTATFNVSTSDDDVRNLSRLVVASVDEHSSWINTNSPDDRYRYLKHPTSYSASANIRDDDLGDASEAPLLEITGPASTVEGQSAVFTINTLDKDLNHPPVGHSAPSEDVYILVRLTQTGDVLFYDSNSPTPTTTVEKLVLLQAGQQSTQLLVPTSSDDTYEPDGSITATLSTDSEAYSVKRGKGMHLIRVDDDDAPLDDRPQISIESANVPSHLHTEGVRIQFNFNTNRLIENALPVKIRIHRSGDFFTEPETEERTLHIFFNNNTWHEFFLDTVGDSTAEPNGHIWIELVPSNDYHIVSPTFARALIRDDDSNDVPQAIIDFLRQNGTPYIPYFREGSGSVRAQIQLLGDLKTPIKVKVLVTQHGGDFLNASQLGEHEITIGPSGSIPTGYLNLKTKRDPATNSNATIRVQLLNGKGYTLSQRSGERSYSFTIYDTATPTLTVVPGKAITEGESAKATFRLDPKPGKPVTVEYSVDPWQGLDWGLFTGRRTLTIPASGSITINIATVDDNHHDCCEQYTTETYQKPEGWMPYFYVYGHPSKTKEYIISEPMWGKSIGFQYIRDNDPPRRVSVSANQSQVTEGGEASFTVTVSPPPTGHFRAVLNIHEQVSTNDGRRQHTNRIYEHRVAVDSTGTATFSVKPDDNNLSERTRQLVVHALKLNYQQYQGTHTAMVDVIDDDTLPPVAEQSLAQRLQLSIDSHLSMPKSDYRNGYLRDARYALHEIMALPPVSIYHNGNPPRNWYDTAVHYINLFKSDGSRPDASLHTLWQDIRDEQNNQRNASKSTISVSVDGATEVTEGTDASFTISASPAPTANLRVNLNVTTEGDVADSSSTGTISLLIPANTASVTHTVATVSDTTDEPNGTVSVTVKHGSDYRRGAARKATVKVNDDDAPSAGTPELTIAAPADAGEGHTFTFTINATLAPAADLDVTVDVSQYGDYLADNETGERTVTIVSGATSATFDVVTVDDALKEMQGTLIATIMPADGYSLGATDSVRVTVNDDEGGPTIVPNEGMIDTLMHEYRTQTNPDAADRALKLALGIAGAPGGWTSVKCVDTGRVYGVLAVWQAYCDEITRQEKELDAAGVPILVKMVIDRPTITEGGEFNVRYELSRPARPKLLLAFTIADTTSDTQIQGLTLPGTFGVYTSSDVHGKTYKTNDNKQGAVDGRLQVQLATSSRIVIIGTNPQYVTVKDNDGGAPDASNPSVTVSADSDAIAEGATITYTITADPAPANDTDVTVNVADSGNFAKGGQIGDRTVTITAGATTATLTVTTENDFRQESDGTITATIKLGTGYALGDPSSKVVNVTDDDTLPELSIAGSLPTVEGQPVTFTVTASKAPKANLPVKVGVSQKNDVVATSQVKDFTVTIEAGKTTGELVINTLPDDNTPEPNGTVTAVIKSGPGYTINTAKERSTAHVADDDIATLTLKVNKATAAEGEIVRIIVKATPVPKHLVYFNVQYETDGAFGYWPLQERFTIGGIAGGTVSHDIYTRNDLTPEVDGSITVTLAAGDYNIGSQNTATAQVTDNDETAQTLSQTQIDNLATKLQREIDFKHSLKWEVDRAKRALAAIRLETPPNNLKEMTAANAQNIADSQQHPQEANFWQLVAIAIDQVNGVALDPVIKLTAVNPDITEGDGNSAQFKLEVLPGPAASVITVDLDITDSGDFAQAGSTGTKQLTISAGTLEKVVTVPIVDDATDESDGTITATLSDGTGYRVFMPNTAVVNVADDDAGTSKQQSGTFVVDQALVDKVQTKADNHSNDGAAARLQKIVDGMLGTAGGYTAADCRRVANQHGVTNAWKPWCDEIERRENAETSQQQADPVIAIQAGGAVTEGTAATFTVTATPPPAANLTVNVSVTESGSYISGSAPTTVTITTSGTATLTVATDGDNVDEPNGSITAALSSGSGYTVSGSNGSATVTVNDDDAPATDPVIAIQAGGAVTEGTAATFTVTATPPPAANLTVNVSVTESGSYISGSAPTTVTITSSGTATLTVATVGDNVDEPNGSVTAALTSGAGYTVSGSNGSATVAVNDDDDASPVQQVEPVDTAELEAEIQERIDLTRGNGDSHSNKIWRRAMAAVRGEDPPSGLPELTETIAQRLADNHRRGGRTELADLWQEIADFLADPQQQQGEPVVSIQSSGNVSEGGTITFTITTTPPTTNLSINVTLTEPGATDRTLTVLTLAGGIGEFEVITKTNSLNEPDRSLTATITAASGYNVSATQGSSTVIVSDDDVPQVSIAAGSGVSEGDAVTFTLSATPKPHAPLTVNVSVTESGSFIAGTAPTTVTIGTDGNGSLTVPTTDDSVDEADGSITATLTSASGYTLGTTSASVAVADDDDAQALVVEPTVTITAGAGVTEGGSATFTVTATPPPDAPLTVNVSVTESGTYIDGAAPTTVTIGTSGSGTLTVPSTDDSADEADGSITATLTDGTGYTLGASKTATVAVADDDDPVVVEPTVTITAGAGVTEGGSATFTVTATPPPSQPLTVNVTVSDAGGFLKNAAPTTLTIGTTGVATLALKTANDKVDEPDGSVSVTLADGTGYTLGGSSTASVAVSDNDESSEASISAGRATARIGETPYFIIQVTPKPSGVLTVNVKITQSTDFVVDAALAISEVRVTPSGRGYLLVDTMDKGNGVTEGVLTVTILDGDGYSVSESAGSVSITATAR